MARLFFEQRTRRGWCPIEQRGLIFVHPSEQAIERASEQASERTSVPKMCTAGKRVLLTITGPGLSFSTITVFIKGNVTHISYLRYKRIARGVCTAQCLITGSTMLRWGVGVARYLMRGSEAEWGSVWRNISKLQAKLELRVGTSQCLITSGEA